MNRQHLLEQIFSRLQFTGEDNCRRLVTELEYGKNDGDIYYDLSTRDNLFESTTCVITSNGRLSS